VEVNRTYPAERIPSLRDFSDRKRIIKWYIWRSWIIHSLTLWRHSGEKGKNIHKNVLIFLGKPLEKPEEW